MNSLTDKTWCIIQGHTEIMVSEEEAELVIRILKMDRENIPSHIQISNGSIIPTTGIKILPPEQWNQHYHTRRGDWQCEYGTWHDRLTPARDCACYESRPKTWDGPKDSDTILTEEQKEYGLKKIQELRDILGRKK